MVPHSSHSRFQSKIVGSFGDLGIFSADANYPTKSSVYYSKLIETMALALRLRLIVEFVCVNQMKKGNNRKRNTFRISLRNQS